VPVQGSTFGSRSRFRVPRFEPLGLALDLTLNRDAGPGDAEPCGCTVNREPNPER
jgi:hypothetical protein